MVAESARLAGSLIKGDLLSPWVRTQRDGLWENKLLEALCIIQNYQILQKLGCNVEHEKTRFLPRSPESSLFVNCMRKALYHVCESLDSTGLEKLLKYVKEDYRLFQKGDELETFEQEYMEINLLYWSSRGYIRWGQREAGYDCQRLSDTYELWNLESVGSHRLYNCKSCLAFLFKWFVVMKRKCDWGKLIFLCCGFSPLFLFPSVLCM